MSWCESEEYFWANQPGPYLAIEKTIYESIPIEFFLIILTMQVIGRDKLF